MKLLLCLHKDCGDVIRIRRDGRRSCRCGRASARYLSRDPSDKSVVVSGRAVVLGVPQAELASALERYAEQDTAQVPCYFLPYHASTIVRSEFPPSPTTNPLRRPVDRGTRVPPHPGAE